LPLLLPPLLLPLLLPPLRLGCCRTHQPFCSSWTAGVTAAADGPLASSCSSRKQAAGGEATVAILRLPGAVCTASHVISMYACNTRGKGPGAAEPTGGCWKIRA
jgi:hypothetical protein